MSRWWLRERHVRGLSLSGAAEGEAPHLRPAVGHQIAHDQRANAGGARVRVEDEGESAVFVVREGKAVRVPVKLGYAEGAWIEIRDGLQPGAQVVVAGKAALREGTAVQVIAPQPAAVAAARPVRSAPKQ